MEHDDDDYATCERTYATLRVYPGEHHPDEVTQALRVAPSSIAVAHVPKSPPGARAHPRPNAWFLSSENHVASRDCRRHIDWLLDQVSPRGAELISLVRGGGRADISCFWISRSGHGGPSLLPKQMAALAALELEIWFDVYMSTPKPE